MRATSSQYTTEAGGGSIWAITIFAIIWNAVIWNLLPKSDAPFFFKLIFYAMSILLLALCIYSWRMRLKGGAAVMKLDHDPIPLGITTTAHWTLDKAIAKVDGKDSSYIEITVEQTHKDQSGWGRLWQQKFPLQVSTPMQISASFAIPHDLPISNKNGSDIRTTLTLHLGNVNWPYLVDTRMARLQEASFELQDQARVGSSLPSYTPEQIVQHRKRFTWMIAAFVLIGFIVQLSMFADWIPWGRLIPVGIQRVASLNTAYPTNVKTDDFTLLVTNLALNDWAVRARFSGVARVNNGDLEVDIQSLILQSASDCSQRSEGLCRPKSVRLLLTRSTENSFSTLAQSQEFVVNVNFAEAQRWRWTPTPEITRITMQLPATLNAQDMKLKLEVRSNDGRTVYPDGGPLLNIQKALARAQGMQSPCAQLTELHTMAQADCATELISSFESTSWGMRLHQWRWSLQNSLAVVLKPLGIQLGQQSNQADATSLLLTAAAHEATEAIPALIRKGAQANASDPDQPGRTALGYVACQNNLPLLESMLAAGARAEANLRNDKGQIITPLTQALRCDAAEAIDRLLKAGASLNTKDPTGWTPMHIAAYESAVRSIPVMIQHGGDVNEKTPAYRQQTALHTALQFAGIPTIEAMLLAGGDLVATDNQQKNACEWARFFKRGPAIEQLVCQQPTSGVNMTVSR